jgi:hypothetical protein
MAILMDDGMFKEIARLAQGEQRSVTSMVRKIVCDWLAAHGDALTRVGPARDAVALGPRADIEAPRCLRCGGSGWVESESPYMMMQAIPCPACLPVCPAQDPALSGGVDAEAARALIAEANATAERTLRASDRRGE